MTWSVMYDIAFFVENCPNENGSGVHPQEIRHAILKRLAGLTDVELYEAVEFCDSYMEEIGAPVSMLCGLHVPTKDEIL